MGDYTSEQAGLGKVPCKTCGRKFAPRGLPQHERDAHGSGPPRKPKVMTLSQAMREADDGDNAWFHDNHMGDR